MKKVIFLLLVFAGFLACENESIEELPQEVSKTEGISAKQSDKIDVCHIGNIINVSVSSLSAHQAHGDAVDMDGDGYFDKENDCSEGVDCDDTDAEVNPGVLEIVYNGVDDDCNSETLDDDLDGDGYLLANDCDDTDPNVNPGAVENCGDEIDNNCNGEVDEGCLAIGDFTQGGIVFYIAPEPTDLDGDGDLDTGLVCAIQDQGRIPWLRFFRNTFRTNSAIGTGSNNTDAIIAQQGTGSSAARLARSYDGGGFDDWFLPSKDELNMMYVNLKAQNLGNFGNVYYWSSTGHLLFKAWRQSFVNGLQLIEPRHRGQFVRAVRAF